MNIKYIALASLSALTLASCSSDSYTELERTKDAFLEQLGGSISRLQWWRTAVTLNVKVQTEAPTKLWLMSDNDKGTLYDYREIETSSNIRMTAPQGKGTKLYLVSVCNRQKSVQEITLSGRTEENIDVKIELQSTDNGDFSTMSAALINSSQTETTPDTRDATSLHGKSYLGESQYYELTNEQRKEAQIIINQAYKEGTPAKQIGANCDYELKSNGDFNITFFAGYTNSAKSHTLGYYYHTPGTYNDIKYVDITETELYDYIDGLAKVQYKVNENAAQKYGVTANHWYDANFDIGDTFENPHPSFSERLGDDAYNSLLAIQRYGSDLTGLRGISFTIKVPEGMYVGFYDRVENQWLPEQYDRFVKLGIKPYTTRDNFKAMNFSCEAMNMNLNGPYRSCVFKTKNALWLGMEDNYHGGDLDCNDVMFEVSAELEIHHPSVVEPDLKPFGEYDDIMPWTIAYEDVARNADFDFNDAIIKVKPNPEKEKCLVTAMAAGSTAKMYLHYDGPNGDQNLGEIHNLLGSNNTSIINTTSVIPQVPFVDVAEVAWPKGYSMEQDAHRFYIEVQRGTCTNCSDVITLAEEPGLTPEALLIAGEWKWPLEGININSAYTSFAGWSRDVTQLNYWNWYAHPKANTCVNY